MGDLLERLLYLLRTRYVAGDGYRLGPRSLDGLHRLLTGLRRKIQNRYVRPLLRQPDGLSRPDAARSPRYYRRTPVKPQLSTSLNSQILQATPRRVWPLLHEI